MYCFWKRIGSRTSVAAQEKEASANPLIRLGIDPGIRGLPY